MSSEVNRTGEQADRVAIVTGGSSGIGRGAANELARQGASVVVHGLTHEEATLVVQEIRGAGLAELLCCYEVVAQQFALDALQVTRQAPQRSRK